ncbi:MAG: TetR/AcrR family transcriptional regulator [Clostridia bacterium]|nr:TetR/AcrR family transcriptional regulator [Clostridia bacterium]
MASKTDLRVLKSKAAIRSAFLELMTEKGYSNITITDIAKRAVINRKTFYMHYESKERLYDEITDELLKILLPSVILEDMQGLKGKDQRKIVTYLLLKIKEHKEVFNILINDKTNPGFIAKLKTKIIDDLISKSHIDLKTKDTHFTFELLSEAYFSLFRVIIQWWVNTENISTDYVIEIILEFFSKKPLELLGINFEK